MLKKIVLFAAALLTAAALCACQKSGGKPAPSSSAAQNPSSSPSSSQASSGASSSSQAPSSSTVSSAFAGDTAVPGQPSPTGAKNSLADPAADPNYVKAYNDYSADRYDSAIAVCDQSVAADKNCFWAYNIKGIALYFANGNSRADEALSLINHSLAINPEYGYGYFNEALIYKGLKKYDYSITSFDKDLSVNPKDQWAYFGISTVYADTDRLDPCLEYLKKSIDLDPSVKETARTESHFQKYRDNPRFQALVD